MTDPSAPMKPARRARPTIEDDIAAALAAPFHPRDVEWRVGSAAKDKPRAMAMAYIDARAVRRRLDQVCGIGGWKCHHYSLGEHQIACEISVKIGGEWVGKTDGGWVGNLQTTGGKIDAREEQRLDMEGKGAFSVAFKRAAVAFGIGAYIYDLPAPWEDVDSNKHFTKDALARLDAIAAKPFEEWKKQQASKRPAAVPVPVASVPPTTAAPPPSPASPPAAPVPPPSPAELPKSTMTAEEGRVLLRSWVERMEAAKDAGELDKIVVELRAKPPFGKGTEEDGAIRAAYETHAQRTGYKPGKKSAAAPPPGAN